MLNLLVKSAVRRKVVYLFVRNRKQQLYSRQVARLIDESPHAVGLELRHLCHGGLLESIEDDGRMFYRLNESYPFVATLESMLTTLNDEHDAELKAIPDLEQRERIRHNLKRVTDDIIHYYNPEKIIVFGSAASGRVGPYSDIDMVIIKKTDLPYFKRVQQLVGLLEYDVDIDFLIYTPEEFEQAVRDRVFFKEEVVAKGAVLYDKAA